jgi:hypothetical protein
VAFTRLRVDLTRWHVLYTFRRVDSPPPSTVAILLPTLPRHMLMFYSLFLFVFCSFYFRAIKGIFTLSFVLTFINVFSVVVVHLWVCYTAVASLLGYGLGFRTFQSLGPFLRILTVPFVVYLTKLPLVAITFLGLCTKDI